MRACVVPPPIIEANRNEFPHAERGWGGHRKEIVRLSYVQACLLHVDALYRQMNNPLD